MTSPVDDLGLVKTVDRLGQDIVVAVANAADRWFDPGLGKALGILDRDVLAAAAAVMDQAASMDWPTIRDRLFEGIQNEAGMGRPADPPAHDIAGVTSGFIASSRWVRGDRRNGSQRCATRSW